MLLPELLDAQVARRQKTTNHAENKITLQKKKPLGLWLYDQGGDLNEDLWGAPDPELTKMVLGILEKAPMLARAYSEQRFSLALVDITVPDRLRYTLLRPDWEIFTASLSKIAVLLGVIHKVQQKGALARFSQVQKRANQMIKFSSNKQASYLFRWAGFDYIRDGLHSQGLYHKKTGGLWWTPSGAYPRSPKQQLRICGTARQVARYLLLMEQGRLISPEGSQLIKGVLHNSTLAIFFRGIKKVEPKAKYYGKPGILRSSISEGMLIEGESTRYILAVLTEGTDDKNLSFRLFGEHLHRAMMERHSDSKS